MERRELNWNRNQDQEGNYCFGMWENGAVFMGLVTTLDADMNWSERELQTNTIAHGMT